MRAQASLGASKGLQNGQVAKSRPLSLICPFLNTHDSSFEMPAWWGSDAVDITVTIPCLAVKNIWRQRRAHRSKQHHGSQTTRAIVRPALLGDESWYSNPGWLLNYRSNRIILHSLSQSFLSSASPEGELQRKEITASLQSAWQSAQNCVAMGKV